MLAAAGSVHTQHWANAFVERGLQVVLASQHPAIPGFDARVRIEQLEHTGDIGYFRNRARLRKLVEQERPDVVNAHYASGYGTTAAGVRGVPVVLNVWGSDVYEFPDRSLLHRLLVRHNLRRATYLISTSHAMAARTMAVCPDAPTPTVVPFGVDLNAFTPAARQDRGRLVIGTVRSLEPVYGVDVLIGAFAQLRALCPDVALELRIVGDGAQRDALREQAERLGIARSVVFVGRVPHPEVPAILKGFDIFCALSRAESFGVAVVEAAACGLPVVAAAVGGLPEVVADGRTGFLVPPVDEAAAAKALARLIGDAGLRERMGREARAFVEERYDRERCVDLAIAVLERASKAARP